MEEKGDKGDKGEKDPPPLRIDPKCLQDALRMFFPAIKSDDPRLDFYTMYKREATEYDVDYVRKYDEDLNTTLIFAGLFSAVSSAFVIDIHSKLEPDPNDQSAAILRAILLTLNQSAIPGETPTIPPAQDHPPSEIVNVTGLMYASLLISLLAAFIAMLGKQWLNRYLRNEGGSMIERCGDRQRKRDGLEKWPFHLFVESLPLMLQAALLLLACGLCRHMASVNHSVAAVLITLTVLGVLFYIGILVAGVSSYECPFQTPVSTSMRSLWRKIGTHVITTLLPIVTAGTYLYKQVLSTWRHFWEGILFVCKVLHVMFWLPLIEWWHCFHNPPLPIIQLAPLEHVPQPASLDPWWENIQCKILHMALHLPQTLPPSTVPETSLWLKPGALATLESTNANDVRCVAWILQNITDPEAFDVAIWLAGVIRWFEDGLDVEPPYNLIISTLRACFDPSGKIYPGSRDRAYYSARAIVWIHICALCKSAEFAHRFPFPVIHYDHTSLDDDLRDLLGVFKLQGAPKILAWMYPIRRRLTPAHLQWTSSALLHLSCAGQNTPNAFDSIWTYIWHDEECTIPLNVFLNHLLASCIFLGWPIGKEVLKIQDNDHFDQTISQFSLAMGAAIHTSHPQCALLPRILTRFRGLETQNSHLTRVAYGWCSVVCESYSSLANGKELLYLALEIGFRHIGQIKQIGVELTHLNSHQKMVDIVFQSQKSETIADFLCAWTSYSNSHRPHPLLNVCAGHLISLHHLQPFSPRLRELLIHSVELIGYQRFEQVGVEGLIRLLDGLNLHVENMKNVGMWEGLLLATIQSPEGTQKVPHLYWELLVELVASFSLYLSHDACSPHIMTSLEAAKEWDKLECWMGVFWMSWLWRVTMQEEVEVEEDLRHTTLSLFHHKPGAIQKLENWIERGANWYEYQIKPFQQVCEQAHLEAAPQAALSTQSEDQETGQATHPQQPSLPLGFGDNTF